MTSIPAAIAAQMAIVQNNAAMSMLKSSNDAAKQVADMLLESIQNVPTGSRGGNLNILV